VGVQRPLEALQAGARIFQGLRPGRQELLAGCRVQGRGHAAGHHPGRVDAPAAQQLDDRLPVLPQADAGPGHLRIPRNDAEEVALGGGRVEAQQQVGRGQVEEREGVGLHELRQVEEPA